MTAPPVVPERLAGTSPDPRTGGIATSADAAPTSWVRGRRPRLVTVLCALLLVIGAAIVSAANVDSDTGGDLLRLGQAIGAEIGHLRWQYVVVVVGLVGLHYLATAIAAQACAGVPLRLGETVLVQLAAAAANRLTPAGLGGSAVTARYFTRRGLDAPAAIGAVAVLSVLGSLADLVVLAALVLLGELLGVNGAAHELGRLASKIGELLTALRSPWLWLAVGLVIILAGALRMRRRRVDGSARRWSHFWLPARKLIGRPPALITLVLASGSTTLVLGFAFVASTAMVPGPQPTVALGALLVAFMLGSAAGSSVPIPAGLGTTEAALIAVLFTASVPMSHAAEVVLIFRLLTFWLPAVLGVLVMRRLRRRDAI